MVFKLIKTQKEDKKECELEINNKRYKLSIEVKMDEIIFKIRIISEISFYNYIRKYKYNDIIKELNLPKDKYDNLSKILNYFKEYEIKEDGINKKLIINNKDMIILYKNKNEEIIEILIEEMNMIKGMNNEQSKKIKNLEKMNEEKDNKIKEIENKYKELKKDINKIINVVEIKEISLIYESEGKEEKIFGEEFVKRNKDNIEIMIEGKKNCLMDKYKLKKGENRIEMILKNKITNLEEMFYECKALKNIEELKYLNTKDCNNLDVCSMDVHQYQI